MTITTVSSEELDQDPERAKTLSAQRPVFVTEEGEPAYALLGMRAPARLPRSAARCSRRWPCPGSGTAISTCPYPTSLPRLPTWSDAPLPCSPRRLRTATGAAGSIALVGLKPALALSGNPACRARRFASPPAPNHPPTSGCPITNHWSFRVTLALDRSHGAGTLVPLASPTNAARIGCRHLAEVGPPSTRAALAMRNQYIGKAGQ